MRDDYANTSFVIPPLYHAIASHFCQAVTIVLITTMYELILAHLSGPLGRSEGHVVPESDRLAGLYGQIGRCSLEQPW